MITKECPCCKKEFATEIPMKIYCTHNCQKRAQRKRYRAKLKNKISICERCGDLFSTTRGHFCQKCLKELLSDQMYERRSGTHWSKETKQKMSISAKNRIRSPHTYTARLKMSIAKQGDRHPNWRGGQPTEYCNKWTPEFRERVRRFFDNTCTLCGKTKQDVGKNLSVHHVNYKKDACCDEDIPRYFVLLCPSCHAKTNYNRDAWEKKFTKILKKKFNGKCFYHKKEQLETFFKEACKTT